MSPLPGVTVTQRTRPASSGVGVKTGTAFMVGSAERGPHDSAVLVHSLDELVDEFGDRQATSLLYDAADAFFREGGRDLYVGRVVGPTPTLATANVSDGAVNTLRLDAASYGSWGADMDVEIVAGDTVGTFIIKVWVPDNDGEIVEESPELADKAAAIAWAAGSDYIRLVDLGAGGDPQAGTVNPAGGTDDIGSVTNTEWIEALDLFGKDLGSGQVMLPGKTTLALQEALLDHAADRNRVALIDLADTATKGTLISATGAIHPHDNARCGAAFSPWGVLPGISGGSDRTVPWSAFEAGMIARSDASGKHANTAVAGANGISRAAIDLSQSLLESDRNEYNNAGVNIVRSMKGTIRTYGFRSLVDPTTDPAFGQFSASREFMSLAQRGDDALEALVFGNVDGKGQFFAKGEGVLRAICLEDWAVGALHGDTPEEAFSVVADESVNSAEDLADGQYTAVIAAKVSPFAEAVTLEIVKVEITEAL